MKVRAVWRRPCAHFRTEDHQAPKLFLTPPPVLAPPSAPFYYQGVPSSTALTDISFGNRFSRAFRKTSQYVTVDLLLTINGARHCAISFDELKTELRQ